MEISVLSKLAGRQFRTVTIPDEEVVEGIEEGEKLELVFRYGQNEFQPSDQPSVTSGDVVLMDNKFFIMENFGFKEIDFKVYISLRELYEKMEDNVKVTYNKIKAIYKEFDIKAF